MRKDRFSRGERGFTLIEFTLATAIGALITGTLVVSLFYFNDLTTRYQDSLAVSNHLQRASSVLNHDVVSARGGTISEQSLTLKIPQYDFGVDTTSPTTKTVEYSISGGNLIRNKDGDSTTVARHIASLDFDPVGPISEISKITVTLTSTMDRSGEDRDQSETTTLVFHRRLWKENGE